MLSHKQCQYQVSTRPLTIRNLTSHAQRQQFPRLSREEKRTPYHLTPERIPAPPSNPVEALQAAHSWMYPSTAEGRTRALMALVLAQAVEVSNIH